MVFAWSIFDPLKVPNKDHPGFKLYGAKLKYDMLTCKQDLPAECNPSESPCKVTSIEWCLQQICSLSHFYPKISNVADIMLSTPVSNAWPERGASCVKRVKTRFRTTLKIDMLQSVLQVSINGPVTGTDNSKGLTKRSVKAWTTAKKRRRLLTRSREETVQLHSESQVHVFAKSGVQTEGLEEMEEVHCVREVDDFYKACNLPNAPDVDEFGDDEGFEDDELLFY